MSLAPASGWRAVALSIAGLLVAPLAHSAPTDAGAPSSTQATCTERVPDGAVRPELEVSFPERGLSGYEARLEIVVHHGPGETVFPEGFRLRRDSDTAKGIEAAGFVLPEVDGGSPPRIERNPEGQSGLTRLSLPFVPLPAEPGRHELRLPSLGIAVARASGEVMLLCTEPQTITVEDPIANESEPEVKPNPPPQPQREPWQLAKQLFFGALATILLGLLFAWLLVRWLRRPRPTPVRPKILPWIAALQELDAIRSSTLLADQQHDEYFDRVNDCVRLYLGERYGFDGLESTLDELRSWLGRIAPPPAALDDIIRYLEDCDFIKFTEHTPNAQDCGDAMKRAEEIVRRTTPPPKPKAQPTPAAKRAA